MNRDEINALDENALRLEVARVLGWKLYHFENPLKWNTSWYKFCKPGIIPTAGDGDAMEERPLREEKLLVFALSPDWTRDIAAAWELVEEMRITHRVNLIDLGDRWQCSAEIKDKLPRYPVDLQHAGDFFANGATPAEAVSRVYLMYDAWKVAQ